MYHVTDAHRLTFIKNISIWYAVHPCFIHATRHLEYAWNELVGHQALVRVPIVTVL